MTKGRGNKSTPPRVVELVKKAVSEKSLRQVAKQSGLGIAAISRYSQGIGEPSADTLQKLAYYFGVDIPWLRGEADMPRFISVGDPGAEVFRYYVLDDDGVAILVPLDLLEQIGSAAVTNAFCLSTGSVDEDFKRWDHFSKWVKDEVKKIRNDGDYPIFHTEPEYEDKPPK